MVGGIVWLKFELLLDIMPVLYTYELKMDQTNSNREKSNNIDFVDAHGQLHVTLWSLVGYGRLSCSSKPLCMPSLPASMKRILSKTAKKKRQHCFSHYKSTGIFSDTQGQLTLESVVRSGRIMNSSDLSGKSSLHVRIR